MAGGLVIDQHQSLLRTVLRVASGQPLDNRRFAPKCAAIASLDGKTNGWLVNEDRRAYASVPWNPEHVSAVAGNFIRVVPIAPRHAAYSNITMSSHVMAPRCAITD